MYSNGNGENFRINFIRDCLKDYHKELLNRLVNGTKNTDNIKWNNAEFMDYVWDKNPRYPFTADDIATINAYSKDDIERIKEEYNHWKIDRARATEEPRNKSILTTDEMADEALGDFDDLGEV